MTGPTILRSGAKLAARLGISRSLLNQWLMEDPRWRACVIRRTKRSTWLSVAKMQAHGFLVDEQPKLSEPALSIGWRIAQ